MGKRAEIADTGVDVQLAVGGDAHEAIEAVEAGGVVGLADADTGTNLALTIRAAANAAAIPAGPAPATSTSQCA